MGWYRYDTYFSIPVKAENEKEVRWNDYTATIVVRINEKGLFLYDIINIKKEKERNLRKHSAMTRRLTRTLPEITA